MKKTKKNAHKTTKRQKPRGNVPKFEGQRPERSGAAKNRGQQAAQKKPVTASPEKLNLIQRLIAVLQRMPHKFPFWARLKIGKNRTTLVIDEAPAKDKQKNKTVQGFVHREATHTPSKNTEKVVPNPDPTDPKPMNLKRPRKTPQSLFVPHNKKLNMPEDLKKRYGKNTKK
ncbi:MAG: hypothetical protein K2L67_06885 [Clostridia bacterium]|nr:hypothetical protein [Clostridia bacterium]